VGSGRPIDTDKYFVISADTLANLNTKDPNVVTTGPASIDPATGRPYGMRFPVVSMRDSVRVHKALVDSLGVKKLWRSPARPAARCRRWNGVRSTPDSSTA
jgi:homoserine O-acetyltransferase